MMFRHFLSIVAILMITPVFATTMGDDGLHKTDWMRETFLDLREDLAEANAEGKRLMVIIEQRGCTYCLKMHEDVFPDPAINAVLHETYFVVQLNMFGDLDVTDFDGTVLPEKAMTRRWNAMFTPMIMFFPEDVPENTPAHEATVAVMPGAFERGTTLSLLTWVRDKGYLGDDVFQHYHARRLAERDAAQ
jgi:thioredoxin-related protein